MQLWKKMKKNRKGFTLVEIIVVLVILAILAAFTIPAMLGFVNEARGKAYIAEAREVYVAYQSAISEVGGSKGTLTADYTGANSDDAAGVDGKAVAYLTGDLTKDAKYKVTQSNGKVTEVEYTAGGYKVTIKDGNSTVTKE